MKIHGIVDFKNNESKQFIVENYDGSGESEFPLATVGKMVFRIDLNQLFICSSTNPIIWAPVIKVSTTYNEEFTNQTSIEVIHNLGTRNILVQVYDINGEQIIPDIISIEDNNTVLVEFTTTLSGNIVIASLDSDFGVYVERNGVSLDVLKSKVGITSIVYNETTDKPTRVNYSDNTYVVIDYDTNNNIEFTTFYSELDIILEKWQNTYDVKGRIYSTSQLI